MRGTKKASEPASVRKARRNAEMIAYKTEGHTGQEVAERFVVSIATVWAVCKGVAPQRPKLRPEEYRNQYTGTDYDQVGNFKRLLALANPRMEYVSGFKTVESFVTLRCLDCGGVFERSCISIRHGQKTICPYCKKAEADAREAAREAAKAEKQAEREQKRKARRETLAKERQEWEAERNHACPVCGAVTHRRVYCSKECANKAANATHEARRRVRIKASLVDNDITLAGLYERDGGVCWVCGLACSWDDAVTIDGTFIAGELYPSIDHVVALSDGGEHAWANVKLAHRRCNSWRYWKFDAPVGA